MTDAEKLQAIDRIIIEHTDAANDDDGDKHLADPNYAVEAIDAVLTGRTSSGVLRMFLEAASLCSTW